MLSREEPPELTPPAPSPYGNLRIEDGKLAGIHDLDSGVIRSIAWSRPVMERGHNNIYPCGVRLLCSVTRREVSDKSGGTPSESEPCRYISPVGRRQSHGSESLQALALEWGP